MNAVSFHSNVAQKELVIGRLVDLFQLSGVLQGGTSSFSLESVKLSICNLDWSFLHVQLFEIAVQFGIIGFSVFNFVPRSGSSGSLGWHFWLYCKKLPSHTGQEQACTRITWLSFGWLSPCRKWRNTQENSFSLPHSNHIQDETLFQATLDQE